jgi:hypothetical protein
MPRLLPVVGAIFMLAMGGVLVSALVHEDIWSLPGAILGLFGLLWAFLAVMFVAWPFCAEEVRIDLGRRVLSLRWGVYPFPRGLSFRLERVHGGIELMDGEAVRSGFAGHPVVVLHHSEFPGRVHLASARHANGAEILKADFEPLLGPAPALPTVEVKARDGRQVAVPVSPLGNEPSWTVLERRSPDLAVVSTPRALRRSFFLPLVLGVGVLLFLTWAAWGVSWWLPAVCGLPACFMLLFGCVGLWGRYTEMVLDRGSGAITFRGPRPEGAPEAIAFADVVCIQRGTFDWDSEAPTAPLHEVNVVYAAPDVARLRLVAVEDPDNARQAAEAAAELIGCRVVSVGESHD